MKIIGIVSCDKWKNLIKEDLLLQKEFLNNGIICEIISWQDKNINYSNYDCLILRSVWGYHNCYTEFKNWLLFLKEKEILLFNDVDIVLANIRKDIQFAALDSHLIPHIPTKFVRTRNELEKVFSFNGQMVVKPIISGSGSDTYIINSESQDKLERSITKEELKSKFSEIINYQENGLMIQPYMAKISDGEYSCIFIDGVNTHNMLRFPGIFSSKKRVNYLSTIPSSVSQLARAVSNMPEYNDYLYMRVDIVLGSDGPCVMEVELAEPDLLIKYIDDNEIQNKALKTLRKRIERRL